MLLIIGGFLSLAAVSGANYVYMKDSNGNPLSLAQIVNQLLIVNTDFGKMVAKDIILGSTIYHIVGTTLANGIGNTLTDIIETGDRIIKHPSPGTQLQIQSTSELDSLTQIGSHVVDIHGLSALDSTEISEHVNVNGTTASLLTNKYIRINSIHVTANGGWDSTSVGNITLTNAAEDSTYCVVTAGHNMSQQGVYTVAINKVAYITAWTPSSISNKAVTFYLRATSEWGERTTLPGIRLFNGIYETFQGGVPQVFHTWIRVEAMASIVVSAKVATGNGRGSVIVEIIVEDV